MICISSYCSLLLFCCEINLFNCINIHFTGWTNGVRNLKAEFIDNENYTIKLSWEPPDYDGGVPVHYYKLILYDYSHDARYA